MLYHLSLALPETKVANFMLENFWELGGGEKKGEKLTKMNESSTLEVSYIQSGWPITKSSKCDLNIIQKYVYLISYS